MTFYCQHHIVTPQKNITILFLWLSFFFSLPPFFFYLYCILSFMLSFITISVPLLWSVCLLSPCSILWWCFFFTYLSFIQLSAVGGDRGCQNACTFRSLGEVYYKTWEILWSFTNQLNTSCCDSTSKHLLGTSEFCKPRKCGSESLHQSLKWGRMWVVLIYAGQHGELMTPIFLLTTDFTSGLKHGILVFCIWACHSCMGKKNARGKSFCGLSFWSSVAVPFTKLELPIFKRCWTV